MGFPLKWETTFHFIQSAKLWLIFFMKTNKTGKPGFLNLLACIKKPVFHADYCSTLALSHWGGVRLFVMFIDLFAFDSITNYLWVKLYILGLEPKLLTLFQRVCHNTSVRISVDKNACLTDQILILNDAPSPFLTFINITWSHFEGNWNHAHRFYQSQRWVHAIVLFLECIA